MFSTSHTITPLCRESNSAARLLHRVCLCVRPKIYTLYFKASKWPRAFPHERTGFGPFCGLRSGVKNPCGIRYYAGSDLKMRFYLLLHVEVKVCGRGNLADHCGMCARDDHFLKAAGVWEYEERRQWKRIIGCGNRLRCCDCIYR